MKVKFTVRFKNSYLPPVEEIFDTEEDFEIQGGTWDKLDTDDKCKLVSAWADSQIEVYLVEMKPMQ